MEQAKYIRIEVTVVNENGEIIKGYERSDHSVSILQDDAFSTQSEIDAIAEIAITAALR